MDSLATISDLIQRLLEDKPAGMTASAVVSELSRQGVDDDDAAAALAAGVGYDRWRLDPSFRVTAGAH